MCKYFNLALFLALIPFSLIVAQENMNSQLLNLDRIYSGEFSQSYERTIQWIENGNAYVIIEKSKQNPEADRLVRYDSQTQSQSEFVSASNLVTGKGPLKIESFSLSADGSKVLIFTNSSRVWRSNTKGDYWVFDQDSGELKQLGMSMEPSSLMFAKFSSDNKYVFYVHKFNIYKENFQTGEIEQLTADGDGDIINGTFDWVYEEEFGKRDGFSVSPEDSYLAFWNLDASDTGVFYMINNTDSIYSRPIPVQYPKVGQEPSAAKIGVIDLKKGTTVWVPLYGGERENYVPGMQWVNDDLLLIQQMNRHQNTLIVWSYEPSTKALRKVYTEKEDTYIELLYPDISSNSWGSNDLELADGGKAFLRMTENDGWRHIYKVHISTGEKVLVTPFDYDVASMRVPTEKGIYYMASPENSMQRYLYSTDIKGKGKQKRLTPASFSGVNNYNIAPNGKYGIHTHQSAKTPRTVRFVSLPDHKIIKTIVDNKAYAEKRSTLSLPEVKFTKVTTEEGIEIDVKMVLPLNFDPNQKYPVIFNVYGEPWGQVATDTQVGLWDVMMAQKGYVIVNMDNRGTPCLKGSEWRKSIYRQVGRINVRDQGLAAKELLKLEYLDKERISVWGWSGGGTMTLNLLFKFPEIYKTGVAVAAVSNQLVYDNIYQERYMGLPQENMQDFIDGSPVTYAKNLEGNLLLIHGTADDNVHYQSAEILINELIKQNKQFQMMAYPNRSHGIYEGENTRKHLYTTITEYIMEHNPPNASN
ncbi:DPP IV N-terminal domain-containing protein [Lutimonas saemankumensis]|uniref:S9 family peptidase n=1 Tax=Lutimonas saemankumensis TaxID=483016 RepID=UPI001CD46E80|nr:DPP IV N-terminal domain-containing protein [Lutimonas saemankumensis]MCA0931446.1 DPP IV N-terminal domain-containing protein [Lutimonas saemankumensis]